MTPPVLITAPTAPVVTLAEMKAHLRVDHSDEDALITALEQAAVAHFDGWKGVLGRAIMEQEWRQEFDEWGSFRLAMPDVTDISVRYCTEETHGHSGEHVYDDAPDVTVTRDLRGVLVTASGPATDNIRVEYTCAMPAQQLPAIKMAVMLLAAHWYENREAAGPKLEAAPLAVDAIVTALRWMDF